MTRRAVRRRRLPMPLCPDCGSELVELHPMRGRPDRCVGVHPDVPGWRCELVAGHSGGMHQFFDELDGTIIEWRERASG